MAKGIERACAERDAKALEVSRMRKRGEIDVCLHGEMLVGIMNEWVKRCRAVLGEEESRG